MKLFKRMIFVLGGGCLAVLLILTVIMVFGIAENRKAVNGTVSDFHSNFLNQSSRNAVLGNSAFLEEKINSYFLLLELLLSGKDPEALMKNYMEHGSSDVDYILLSGTPRPLFLANPKRGSKASVLSQTACEQLLREVKSDLGSKLRKVVPVPESNAFWVICSHPETKQLALIRVDGNVLLAELPTAADGLVAALVVKDTFLAIHAPDESTEGVEKNMKSLCRNAEHSHSQRLISNIVVQDNSGKNWSLASAHLFIRSQEETGIHLLHAQRTPDTALVQMASIEDSMLGILWLFLGSALLALLIFTPVLLIFSRSLSRQVNSAAAFVRNVFHSEERPRNLELNFSEEIEELSGNLNLLRDKLSNALTRLSRSHERELRAKKEAEESNILRSGLLTSVLEEVREPLSRIDGYSYVISKQAEENPELAAAAESIRLENRAMISVFRALSDLISLDSDFCTLGSYEIEPSEIIRDALSDLTERAARNHISLEIRNVATLDDPLTTSPSILTHMVYTAIATLIRFMPEHTTLRISSERKNKTLIFRFADQTSDHLSIAEVFRNYTETGLIDSPHCAVAVLNLLILRAEAEYLCADIRIEKTEQSNSMIEISLPVQTFNPAVTGVFTRPKLMAVPEESSAEARFHVAGITSYSLSGRDPFRSKESIGAVLLANMKEPDISLYKKIFGAEGFAVAAAENEEERFGYIRNNRFDLVFLDMTLEQEKNYGVISDLRSALPASTVLIVFTDSRKVEEVKKLLDHGADFCYRKPVVFTDLLFSINKLKQGGKDFL